MSYAKRQVEADLAAAADEHYLDSICIFCGHSRDEIVMEGEVYWVCGQCESREIDVSHSSQSVAQPFTLRFNIVVKTLEDVNVNSSFPELIVAFRQAIRQVLEEHLGVSSDTDLITSPVTHDIVRHEPGVQYCEKIHVTN